MRLHADQLPADTDLARRLLRAQFPRWAELALRPFPSDGTSNAIYRRIGYEQVATSSMIVFGDRG